MSTPCEGCALTEGAAANCEPKNNLTAQLCVLGAIPFYCHEGFEWQAYGDGDPMPKRKRAELKTLGATICQGWRREVKELAAAGYYDGHRESTRAIAVFGIVQMNKMLAAEEGSLEKREASASLGWAVQELGQQRRKFMEGRAMALGEPRRSRLLRIKRKRRAARRRRVQ